MRLLSAELFRQVGNDKQYYVHVCVSETQTDNVLRFVAFGTLHM